MLPRLRRFLIAVVVVLQLAPPAAALAQPSRAGVVTTLEGNVTVTTASLPQPRPLKFRDDVFVNDRVVTGDRSIARMLLGGKAVVTVRERSSLTITEIPGKSTIALESGKIAVAVAREKVRPGEQIEVRTPNAVAGVRGTVFVAEVSRASASLDAAQGAVNSSFYGFAGLVTIRTGSQVVTLNPGMYVSATGLAPAISGVMTDAMRALALAGLQASLKLAGGATQELANEQAMGTTVATFSASAAAVGSDSQPASGLDAGPTMRPPLLPGGIGRIPTPDIVQAATVRGESSTAFLLFGDRSNERAALAAQITRDFASRVMVDVDGLPSDLSAYGTAWHVGAFVPATDTQQTMFRAFVEGGGRLYLTGERPCCEALNASLTTFVRSVVDNGSGITIGGQGDIGGPYTFSPGDRGGIAERLLAIGITQFQPSSPGGIVGVGGANVLVSSGSGTVIGAVWDETDLLGGAGRVAVLMDVNWLLNPGATSVIQSLNAFLVDDAAPVLELRGPLFQSVNDNLGAAGERFVDIAGYTVIGSSADPVVALSGSSLELPGSLLRLADSTLTNGGSLIRLDGGGEIVQTGSAPVVSMSAGRVNVGGHLVDIVGRPEATEQDSSTGLTLGTDRPLQPGAGAPVFQADNGSIVASSGHGFRIDTAVLEATAPLLALNGSALATGIDAIALVKQARVEIPNDAVALVSLRGGVLNVANGSLVNVAGGSRLGVAGSLVSLAGGSTLNVFNGALLSVSGGSVVNIGGSLVSFSGSGNVLNVTNSFVPTALISGIPVYGPAASFTIGGTPLAGLGTSGAININGVPLTPTTPLSTLKGSLIAIQDSGTVKIGP